MEEKNIIYDCLRGCSNERTPQGELICRYDISCCKRGVFNWLGQVSQEAVKDIYEVRFKNTRKIFFENTSNQILKIGDIVVVEANSGHDVGIVTLSGPIVALQMKRNRINPETYEFKKIYRKAKPLDTERWQEAIAREHETMIRARQISAEMKLNMKIGDVEFQGDGRKAIFYYIADERVDFRELIKVFAEEFKIRIEMRQIGARQEAALIGGLGVCGRALCCSNYITNFHSITTQSARCQDLSLNPQKLAGQCGKLKCCINYEAPVYMDAHSRLPRVNAPLQLLDGEAHLVKTDILKGLLWFSYDPHNMANMIPLTSAETIDILKKNSRGVKPKTLIVEDEKAAGSEFVTAVGDDNIDRFDRTQKKNSRKRKARKDRKPNDKKTDEKKPDERKPVAKKPNEKKPNEKKPNERKSNDKKA